MARFYGTLAAALGMAIRCSTSIAHADRHHAHHFLRPSPTAATLIQVAHAVIIEKVMAQRGHIEALNAIGADGLSRRCSSSVRRRIRVAQLG